MSVNKLNRSTACVLNPAPHVLIGTPGLNALSYIIAANNFKGGPHIKRFIQDRCLPPSAPPICISFAVGGGEGGTYCKGMSHEMEGPHVTYMHG